MSRFKGPISKPPFPEDTEVPTVSYDEPGILECEIDDVRYRIDSGRQGTALALSTCPVGSWDWTFVAEMKWDGSDFQCRQLDYQLRSQLSVAFKQAIENRES